MHCAGRDSPTDLTSKGLTAQELTSSQLWGSGPTWLKNDEIGGSPDPQVSIKCLVELKGNKLDITHGLLTSTITPGI